MGYEVISTRTFRESLRKLDRAVAKRILAKINELKKDAKEIILYRVGHRKEIYKNL